MPICHKCHQNKDENQIRKYHLTLGKSARRSNSILAGLDNVNLCFSCDSARKTSIGRFLEGQ